MDPVELKNFFKRISKEKEISLLLKNDDTVTGVIMEANPEGVMIDESQVLGDIIQLPYETIKLIVA